MLLPTVYVLLPTLMLLPTVYVLLPTLMLLPTVYGKKKFAAWVTWWAAEKEYNTWHSNKSRELNSSKFVHRVTVTVTGEFHSPSILDFDLLAYCQ